MCTDPIQRHRKILNKTVVDILPCGKCPECLKKKQSGFMVRAIEECRKYGRCTLVTLTYNDNSVPKREFIDEDSGEIALVNSLNREDIKKWKREVRRDYFKRFSCPFPKFSFAFCGEYGPRTFRPHYHGLLIGLDQYHLNILEKYWQEHYGFTVFENVPIVSTDGNDNIGCAARYVSKYCVKPQEVENPLVSSGVVEKPRLLTSVGFGMPEDFDSWRKYMLNGNSLSLASMPVKDVSIINNRLNYIYNGFKYSLPLYLRKKLLYEKNLKGNLVASTLSKVLSATVRNRTVEDFNRKLRQLPDNLSEREAIKEVHRLIQSEEFNILDRYNFARKDLLDFYKQSRF